MENKIVKLNLLNFLDFYTVWSYIILIISIIMILLFKNFINLYNKNLLALTILIMLIIVSIGGFILTHIYPKYIYLKTTGGLNDSLVQLYNTTEYAIKHGYTIILEITKYSATDLNSLFDFSTFPVPVLTNHLEMQDTLKDRLIEPSNIKSLKEIKHKDEYRTKDLKAERLLQFKVNKIYPPDTVLITVGRGGGSADKSINILKHIRLRPAVIDLYNEKVKEYNIPEEYNSIHLRATDRKLNIRNNIAGIPKNNSDSIIKSPSSGNRHKDSLEKIDKFIKVSSLPVFVSGDNAKLLNMLIDKYPQIIKSRATNDNIKCRNDGVCRGLHQYFGRVDPDNLKKAIVDLLILAKGKAVMTSAGGYSQLVKKLSRRRDILNTLLA
jgi:hypothetical protein